MLADFLALNVFHIFMVFTRLAAAIAAFPGLGGTVVPRQVRLLMAIAVTLLVTPLIGDSLPAMPGSPVALFLLILGEVVVGAFLGLSAQVVMSALSVAGTAMAMQASLMNVLVPDPVTQQQGNLLPGFFGQIALVLIFILDLHHLMLNAVISSYEAFPPGAPLPLADFANSMTQAVSHAFTLGIQLAGPLIVLGLIFNVALGLVSRLMPQMQVFFVAMPINVLGGLTKIMIILPVLMAWFMGYFEDQLVALGGMR